MHISNDRYFLERERHDLALRMIRHEARTHTIRACTGLSDDRIRGLYRTYASHAPESPVRRRRGKSPRCAAFFLRNVRTQYEASLLASTFAAFGLLDAAQATPGTLQSARLFCDAYETHRQLVRGSDISFEHAWFLLQALTRRDALRYERCRRCETRYLREAPLALRRACPACKLKGRPARRSTQLTAPGKR